MIVSGGIYIAGSMRGQEDCGFPKFFEAESWLLANTHFSPVFNPARRDVEVTGLDFRGKTDIFEGNPTDLATAMQADNDFIMSDDCAAIVLLPGWEHSVGSVAEMGLAYCHGKAVYHLHVVEGHFYLWPASA